jgi:hypothetical protein
LQTWQALQNLPGILEVSKVSHSLTIFLQSVKWLWLRAGLLILFLVAAGVAQNASAGNMAAAARPRFPGNQSAPNPARLLATNQLYQPENSFKIYLPLLMAGGGSIWLSAAELAALPVSGTAWNNVWNAAQRDTSQPNISDQNDRTDVDVLAKALVYARTGDSRYRNEVIAGIMAAIGSEGGSASSILAVGRNTMPYVIAADLVNLSANSAEDQIFRSWLAGLRHFVFSGDGGSHSLISCHEQRPNNFGTHCGASRIAIALYLGDSVELDRAATVFRGWLGDRNAYTGFSFGDLAWQCNPNQPVGINPAGCTRDGRSIDGVLPDDQRRGGAFTWPPPKENYVWEALQGAVAQAQLLHRAGYPAWQWQDQALRRAVTWLHTQANFPAEDDDRWQPWLVNNAYGTGFPASSPTSPGKGMAWADWSHAP